jgi:hypothetical protein
MSPKSAASIQQKNVFHKVGLYIHNSKYSTVATQIFASMQTYLCLAWFDVPVIAQETLGTLWNMQDAVHTGKRSTGNRTSSTTPWLRLLHEKLCCHHTTSKTRLT